MKVDKNKIQKNNFGAGTYWVIFCLGLFGDRTCRDTKWDLSRKDLPLREEEGMLKFKKKNVQKKRKLTHQGKRVAQKGFEEKQTSATLKVLSLRRLGLL